MESLSFTALFAALGAGLLVHPVAMLFTSGFWMGKSSKRSFPKNVKITVALSIITGLCVLAMFLGLGFIGSRRGVKLLIITPIAWAVAMKAYLTYALEQEQVDEFTLIAHYGAVHTGLYFLLQLVVE